METEEQLGFASEESHAICLAPPGSGKTATMVKLTSNLVMNKANIVKIITFTKTAALELNERLANKINAKDMCRVSASTFDSMQAKQFSQLVNKRPTLITNTSNFIFRCLNSFTLELEANQANEIVEYYAHFIDYKSAPPPEIPSAIEFYEHFLAMLKKSNSVTFSIISRTVCLAMASEGKLDLKGTTHLLVDEYQDTSPMQYEWIKSFADRGVKVQVVGDDDQLIFGFRTSLPNSTEKPACMFNQFFSDYKPAFHTLSKSFRCRPEILKIANNLIDNNTSRIEKKMVAHKPAGGVVEMVGFKNKKDEFEAAAKYISEREGEFGVLCRTQNELDALELQLTSFNVKYSRAGSKSIWDNPASDVTLKLLWTIRNPERFNYLPEVLSYMQESEDVIDAVSSLKGKRIPFHKIELQESCSPTLNTLALQDYFNDCQVDTASSIQLSETCTKMVNILRKSRAGLKCFDHKVIECIADIIVSNASNNQFSFFETVDQLIKKLTVFKQQKSNSELVQIMTLHSSKGLQFENVLILNVNENSIPSAKAVESDSIYSVEEERRLFFVGVTRAVENIRISFNYDPNSSSSKEPSRFLAEASYSDFKYALEKLESDNSNSQDSLASGLESISFI